MKVGRSAEVAAIEVEIARRGRRAGGLLLDPAPEADPHVAVREHRLDHVGCQAGIAELADHPGPAAALAELDQRHPPGRRSPAPTAELDAAAALEEQLADQEPAPLGDEDDAPLGCGAGVRAAGPAPGAPAARPSSGLVLGLSFAFTCGAIPVPLIEVPLRVRYSPTVRSSAPPLFSGITSWKVPLPKEVVPTTVARPDCSSAAVTISEADAVSPLIRTTIGWRGSASPVASKVLVLWVRPWVETIVAVGDEDARDQHRLREQAAAVAPQVEHQPLGALRVEAARLPCAARRARRGRTRRAARSRAWCRRRPRDVPDDLGDLDLAPGDGHLAALPVPARRR